MTELYNYRDQMGKLQNRMKLLAYCINYGVLCVVFKIVKARRVKCFRIK